MIHIITREMAICMYWKVEINEQNIDRYTHITDQMLKLQVCYLRDPRHPCLVSFEAIEASRQHITYHTYPAYYKEEDDEVVEHDPQ